MFINWNRYPQTEIQNLVNCASQNCAQLYAQMKMASIHTCDVQEFEIIRAEEVLQEINTQQINYYSCKKTPGLRYKTKVEVYDCPIKYNT